MATLEKEPLEGARTWRSANLGGLAVVLWFLGACVLLPVGGLAIVGLVWGDPRLVWFLAVPLGLLAAEPVLARVDAHCHTRWTRLLAVGVLAVCTWAVTGWSLGWGQPGLEPGMTIVEVVELLGPPYGDSREDGDGDASFTLWFRVDDGVFSHRCAVRFERGEVVDSSASSR